MIFDNIRNCGNYICCHEGFDKAFEFLKKALEEDLSCGKYVIDGDRIFAFIQEYESKAVEEAMSEAHRKYIDIQCMLSGVEMQSSFNIAEAVESSPFDEEKDLGFYEEDDKALVCVLQRGDFAVYFCHDVHRPGMCFEGKKAPAKKVVVKVLA